MGISSLTSPRAMIPAPWYSVGTTLLLLPAQVLLPPMHMIHEDFVSLLLGITPTLSTYQLHSPLTPVDSGFYGVFHLLGIPFLFC